MFLAKVIDKFEPIQFVRNLKYMGLGMLGIFIVTLVIIGSVLLLGKLTSEKKTDPKE